MSSDTPDFKLPPPPAVMVQVAALRAAFPEYAISVIRSRGEKPRYEAVSKTGGDPYCLISESAAEIWRELRAASKRAALKPSAG